MEKGILKFKGGLPPRLVGSPQWGRQHLGYAPSGALDQTSFHHGNALLGQEDLPCLELMLPPFKIHFSGPGQLVLTGADHELILDGDPIQRHHRHEVDAGSELLVKPRGLGARLYLQMKGGLEEKGSEYWYTGGQTLMGTGVVMKPDWLPEPGVVRVIKGPEWEKLEAWDPEAVWKINPASSSQGLRLEGPVSGTSFGWVDEEQMLSGPVFDGTVQLSPDGPIVLLRDRQCVGGYPRVLQVIKCDVDLLAQFLPGQLLRFRMLDLETAEKLNERYHAFLAKVGR